MSTFAQVLRCVTHETSFLTQWIAIDSLGVGHCCGFTIIAIKKIMWTSQNCVLGLDLPM